MWDVLVRTPLGSLSKRKLVMSVATFLVVVLGYLFVTPATAYAADAQWNGDAISYDAKDFTGPFTAGDNDKSSLPKGTVYYATYDTASTSTKNSSNGYLIYFPKNTQTKTATNAYYSEGDFDQATGRFTGLSPPKKLSLDSTTFGTAATLQPSSCDVDGIGWVVCPVSKFIAAGMDFIYGLIEGYLIVTPLTGGDNGIYQMWDIVRNIANILFIIGFLVLIYAQITGSVMSNYTLKKILPRVVVAAVLVNISYWISAVGVDLSNVIGESVRQLFLNMYDQLGAANSTADDIGWEKVTGLALGGGSLATIGILGATGGSATALVFLILAALVPAVFAVFVAVAILAARQALLTVMIIISPIAFVAYLLPNTEEWFKRWRKFFMSLLVMFPAFAAVFGGSQLAGKLIIQNASSLSVVILGLLVQVVPLFVAPLLIRLSSGLLSTIAGITNDKSKGVFDGARNWANSNKDYHRARGINRGLRPRSELSGLGRVRPLTSVGARVAMSSKNRENRTQALMSGAEGLQASRTRGGRRTAHIQQANKEYQSFAENRNNERYEDYLAGNNLGGGTARLPMVGSRIEQRRQDQSAALLRTTQGAHTAHSNAEALKSVRDGRAEAHYQADIESATVGDGSREGQIREARVNAVSFSGQAEVSKAVIEKQGQELLKRTIANDNNLTRQVVLSHQFEKEAEQYNTIVQKAAEESWNNRVRTNQATRELFVRATVSDDAAKYSEEQTKTIIENMRASGTAVPGASAAEQQLAHQLRDTFIDLEIENRAQQNSKTQQSIELTEILKQDVAARQRAGGIRGNQGAETVLASAVAQSRKEYNERVAEKTQLSRHFNLSSSDKQTVAMGTDVTKTDDAGVQYTFRANDQYARESVIEDQLKGGSFGEIEAIIESAGAGGANHAYRTTIRDAIVANGLPSKALYWGSKTIDDVGQGLYDANTKDDAIAFHVHAGKVRPELLASQSAPAAESIFNVINNQAAIGRLSPAQQADFATNYQQMQYDAWKIMHDDQLLSRADTATRAVLTRFMREP